MYYSIVILLILWGKEWVVQIWRRGLQKENMTSSPKKALSGIWGNVLVHILAEHESGIKSIIFFTWTHDLRRSEVANVIRTKQVSTYLPTSAHLPCDVYTHKQKNRGWQPSHTCYAWRLSIKFSTHRIGVIWRDRGSKMVSDETTEAENKRWKHETNLEGRNDG